MHVPYEYACVHVCMCMKIYIFSKCIKASSYMTYFPEINGEDIETKNGLQIYRKRYSQKVDRESL